jgi:hypothetical protein
VLNRERLMKKPDKDINLELIKLLCILSILNDLQQKPVTEDFQKLSMKNLLD